MAGRSIVTTLRRDILLPFLSERAERVLRRIVGRPEIPSIDDLMRTFLVPALRARGTDRRPPPRGTQARMVADLVDRFVATRTEHWAEIGARHGMAVAFPMLDRRLVEFTLSIPPTWFRRGGLPRRMFRDATAGLLPEVIRRRREKLSPFPEMPLLFVRRVPELRSRLHALRGHHAVPAIFDLAAIDRALEGLPDETTIRRMIEREEMNPAVQRRILALLRTLVHVALVEAQG
jgi:asparagine synthase (glutamine-hydrolysing)